MKNLKLSIIFFFLSLYFVSPTQIFAGNDLDILCTATTCTVVQGTLKLFEEGNVVPGQTFTQRLNITNQTAQTGSFATHFVNVLPNVPSPNLPEALFVEIREGAINGPVVVGATPLTLKQLVDQGQTLLSNTSGNQTKSYFIKTTFDPTADNRYQNLSTQFDIDFGVELLPLVTPTPGGGNPGGGGGGGGSVNGASSGGGGGGGGGSSPSIASSISGGNVAGAAVIAPAVLAVNQVLAVNIDEASGSGQIAGTTGSGQEGQILGEETCAVWRQFLPWILLFIQAIVTFVIYFFRRNPEDKLKHIAVVVTMITTIGIFYWLRECDCFTVSLLSILCKWYFVFAILVGFLTQFINYALIEKEEVQSKPRKIPETPPSSKAPLNN